VSSVVFYNSLPERRTLTLKFDDCSLFCFPIVLFITISDLSEPSLSVNGNFEESLDIHEGESLTLSCTVEGSPTPGLSISRHSQANIRKSGVSDSLELSIPEVKCSNSDVYRCTGSSVGFLSKHKEITVGVLCKLHVLQ
jgi:hypothetical protein